MPDVEAKEVLRLPTARVVHEDTGLSLSYICEVYGFEEVRTLKKHLDELPLNLTPHKKIEQQSDIDNIINGYQERIMAYYARFSSKEKRVRL